MCLGGGGKVPQAPNTDTEQQGAGAIGQAGANAGASQLNWANGQVGSNSATNTGVQNSLSPQIGTDVNANTAGANMFGSTLGGLNQQLGTAQAYGNTAGMNTAQSNAEAGTAQAYTAARQNNMQQLGSYGVDPSQMKSGALNLNANMAQAGAVGNAGYQAGQQRQLTGMGLVSNALNQNTMASSVGQGYGAGANQTGSNVAGIGNQTLGANSSALTAPSTMMQAGLSGYGTQANIANQTFGNQFTSYNANQANANALMNMVGSGIGMAAGAATSGGHADGGAIPRRYANGGAAQPVPVGGEVTPVTSPFVLPQQQQAGGGGGGGSNPMSSGLSSYQAVKKMQTNKSGQDPGAPSQDEIAQNYMNKSNFNMNGSIRPSGLDQADTQIGNDPTMAGFQAPDMSAGAAPQFSGDAAAGAADTAGTGAGSGSVGGMVGSGAASAAAPAAAEAAAPAAAEAVAPAAAEAVGGAAGGAAAGAALDAAVPAAGEAIVAAAPALLDAVSVADGGAIPQRKRYDYGNPAVQHNQQPMAPPLVNIPGPWVGANGGSPGPGMVQHGMSDGSGIDDQVHARVSVGEYIIPADVVHAKGKEFFDMLLKKYHVPAQQQRQQMRGRYG